MTRIRSKEDRFRLHLQLIQTTHRAFGQTWHNMLDSQLPIPSMFVGGHHYEAVGIALFVSSFLHFEKKVFFLEIWK